MKVKELVTQLNNFDPEMDVHYTYQSPGKDHWLSPCIEGAGIQHVIWSWLNECPRITETLTEHDMAREVVVLFP